MPRLRQAWVVLPLLFLTASSVLPTPKQAIQVTPVVVATASNRSEGPPVLRYRCSGVTISDDIVATAAHCLDDGVDLLTVASGGSNICTGEWSYAGELELLHIDEVADLALVKTSNRLSHLDDPVVARVDSVVAVGWQRTRRAGPLLCELAVAAISPERCEEPTHPDRMCFRSGGGESGVCSGLSGAPIIDERRVIAIVSASDGCGAEARVEGVSVAPLQTSSLRSADSGRKLEQRAGSRARHHAVRRW